MHSLGAVRASVYIYLVPVITVVFSALILGEPVTVLSLLGMGAYAGGAGAVAEEVTGNGFPAIDSPWLS